MPEALPPRAERGPLPAGSVEVDLPPGSLVVADLHLDPADPAAVEPFAALCARIAGIPRLVVLGDLFDAWVGPAHLSLAGAARAVRALADLARAGTAIEVVHGNRDFLLDAAFERASSARVHPAGLLARLAASGERVLLLHGDELCTADRGYQRLRRVVRSRLVRGAAPRVPLPLALWVARRLRRASTEALRAKPPEEKRMQRDAALRAAAEAGAAWLVCGHAHEARDERLPEGRRWIVLDAFGGERDALAIDAQGRPGLCSARAQGASCGPRAEGTIAPMDPGSAPPEPLVVAIDGPAASGKSSVGRRVARRLGLAFLDTGLLYRAAALAVVRGGVDPADGAACAAALRDLQLEFDPEGRLHVDGRLADLRSDAVERVVSQVAAHPEVRRELLPVQRSLAERLGGVVAVGRDVTTVVFPGTPHKFYLEASVAERVRRRLLERRASGAPVDEEAIAAGIRARDLRDSTRADAPLERHPEAQLVDTDRMGLDEVVERVLAGIAAR